MKNIINHNMNNEPKDSHSDVCGFHCIKINDINVAIGNTTILKDISLHIHCGKITAIIGKNGAGKTTLIKAILGEIKHEGSISFMNLRDQTVEDLKIGYVPQNINIDKNTPMSVYDLFAALTTNSPVFLRKKNRVYDIIKSQLEKFGAEELIDKRVSELSGGELQRVLISIAITPVPNLLLLDEPVSGIDRNGMELFYRAIAALKNDYDLAMIIVSHDFDFVRRYADHVILLDGTILAEGSPTEVLSSTEFRESFI